MHLGIKKLKEYIKKTPSILQFKMELTMRKKLNYISRERKLCINKIIS